MSNKHNPGCNCCPEGPWESCDAIQTALETAEAEFEITGATWSNACCGGDLNGPEILPYDNNVGGFVVFISDDVSCTSGSCHSERRLGVFCPPTAPAGGLFLRFQITSDCGGSPIKITTWELTLADRNDFDYEIQYELAWVSGDGDSFRCGTTSAGSKVLVTFHDI